MSDHPIIWAMAKAHYEATNAAFAGEHQPFDEMTEWRKGVFYDSMWAALAVLRVPSEDMLSAATAWTMNCEGVTDLRNDLVNQHEAMIDKLREVT